MSSQSLHQHPAWFGSVMGTAALSVAMYQSGLALVALEWVTPHTTPAAALTWASVAFLVLASVLAAILTPRYLTRSKDREALAHEMSHPAHGAMLATFPAGFLVLAVAWGRVGPEFISTDPALAVSAVLIVVGALGAVALSVVWAAAQGRGVATLADVHGGWLIPPVMSLLVPLALAPQITAYPGQAEWLLAVSLAFYGIGFFLFIAIFTLLIARLALRPPLAHALSPSLWVPLAPAGIVGLALLKTVSAGVDVGVWGSTLVSFAIVVTAMGLGLGLWWMLFAIGDLLRVRLGGGLPFHPGWWSFVFPIAAMQLSMTALGVALDSAVVMISGLGLGLALLAVWFIVGVRTLGAVIHHRAMRT